MPKASTSTDCDLDCLYNHLKSISPQWALSPTSLAVGQLGLVRVLMMSATTQPPSLTYEHAMTSVHSRLESYKHMQQQSIPLFA